jgi:nicotinamide riboside transporter PnuC
MFFSSRTAAKVVLFLGARVHLFGWLEWVSSKWAESAAQKYSIARRNLLGYLQNEASLSTCISPLQKTGNHGPFLIRCIVFIIIIIALLL